MHFQLSLFVSILSVATLVSAHGKVASVVGDAGGNGTALGIMGGIVPGAGSNDDTEIDTTVFKRTKIATNGLGRTVNGGKNKAIKLHMAMAQSGDTLPQVSQGGSISGVFHIVTTDGAGPISAIIDTSATGSFSNGTEAEVTQNIPGKDGNIQADGTVARSPRSIGLVKRAANVNKAYAFKIAVPANTTCNGSVAGLHNVCFMKIANANEAGPFGGVVAFQMETASASAPASNATLAVVSPARRALVRRDMNAAIGATMAKRFVA